MDTIQQPASSVQAEFRRPGRTATSEFRRRRPTTARLSACFLLVLALTTCCEARLLAKNVSSAAVLNRTETFPGAAESPPSQGVNQPLVDTSIATSTHQATPSLGKKREPIVEVEEEQTEENTVTEENIHVVTNPTVAFDDDYSGEEDDDLFKEKIFVKEQRSSMPSNLMILLAVAWVFSMVFTAWQMSDNPDGIFAAMCRLILSAIQLVLQILTSPCRKCCGYNESYGRISTMDYGYKDPALELS